MNKKEVFICSKCKKEKKYTEFSKNRQKKYGISSICYECKRKEDNNRYIKQKSKYIYMIFVDREIWWIGSCVNIRRRINNHRSFKASGQFRYICSERNISLEGRAVDVYVCDIEEQRLNLTMEDLRFYEHKLIRELRPKLNKKDNSKYIERDRYIDEIFIGGFKFRKSNYRI